MLATFSLPQVELDCMLYILLELCAGVCVCLHAVSCEKIACKLLPVHACICVCDWLPASNVFAMNFELFWPFNDISFTHIPYITVF